ncbi:MAG: M10 family metallopeptidase C-terminal domain-containing protein, partial [Pseudomonadota bacterium]
ADRPWCAHVPQILYSRRLGISALQTLYGANYNHLASDTVYRWSATTGEAFIDGVGQGAPGANRIFSTVWDGGGVDTFDFSNYGDGVLVDLSPGGGSVPAAAQRAFLNWADGRGAAIKADGAVYASNLFEGDERALIENAVGGAGADTISGNQGENRLTGGAGADRLNGLGDADVLLGGLGGDTIRAGAGADRAFGEGGGDMIWGEGGADLLVGAGGDDRLRGGRNDDKLKGGEGRDHLRGGAADDTLLGGADEDVLNGGRGDDTLRGGRDADAFVFRRGGGEDKVADFKIGEDVLDFSAFNASEADLVVTTGAGGAARLELADVVVILRSVDAEELPADAFLF